jgi:proton-dependent oligopeptide transporter, POT family
MASVHADADPFPNRTTEAGTTTVVIDRPTARPARPHWFGTLFLTDMWERFSFFGMQAILVLYAAAAPGDGGLGLPRSTAVALFGAYVGTVFIASMPGGWLGDRVLGERRSVLLGGSLIACGHFVMAVPYNPAAYLGLALIAGGTGLLKPNLMTLLGRFHGPGEPLRREATYMLFYTSIQVSALVAPLVTGFLGETVNWHAGFAAAGVGMVLGLLRFAVGSRQFGAVGSRPENPASRAGRRRVLRRTAVVSALVVSGAAADVLAGRWNPMHAIALMGLLTLVSPVACFLALRRHRGLDEAARSRLVAFGWVLAANGLFWMFVIQAGSLLSLFAEHQTNRGVAGHTVPAGWFQSVTPLTILLFASLLGRTWTRAGGRLPLPAKLAFGLACAGTAMAVMAAAARQAEGGHRVSPLWLLAAMLLLGFGEVVLAPVALSATADVAPSAFAGRVMGLFWMCSALGAGLGGLLGRLDGVLPAPRYYALLALLGAAAAAALLRGSGALTRRLAPATGETAPGRTRPSAHAGSPR